MESPVTDFGNGLRLIPAEDRHVPYLISTFTRSALGLVKEARFNHKALGPSLAKAARRLYDAKKFSVLVGSDPGVVQGFVAGSPGYLFHVYVPRDLRGHGLGRKLVLTVCGEAGFQHAFPSKTGNRSFNPYLLSGE
jgi:GNAT superfamily N-acetyltransferase